jgi:hypothetical protein
MRKRIGLMIIMAMLATAFLVADSSAAPALYVCTVEAAGPQDGVIYIGLTSAPAFTWKWFIAPTNIQNEILAISLTAMSNGMQVLVQTDASAAGYPLIKNFYLLK